MEAISGTLKQSALVVEMAGIGIILLGLTVATGLFLYQLVKRDVFERAYQAYRRRLGRAILLGLEFLVAADIIGTVAVEPNFHNLGVLGLIVVIRTFLSFALEVEIEGRWPWQQAQDKSGSRG